VTYEADKLANAATRGLRAYDPGHDLPALRKRFGPTLAELGSNENPIGPSPHALAAIQSELANLFRYPDPKGGALDMPGMVANNGLTLVRARSKISFRDRVLLLKTSSPTGRDDASKRMTWGGSEPGGKKAMVRFT